MPLELLLPASSDGAPPSGDIPSRTDARRRSASMVLRRVYGEFLGAGCGLPYVFYMWDAF